MGANNFDGTNPLFRGVDHKKEGERSMKVYNVKKLVILAMLGSISYVLMVLNFPFPGLPPFLKIDFSDIPAIIAALIFGPVAGIIVELLKNVLDFVMIGSPTGVPVGHIANFVAGVLFVLPTYYIFKVLNSKHGMTIALVAGTIIMSLLMSVLNYYVVLPAYTLFMNWDAMSSQETRQFVTTAILPFNILKGGLITIVFTLLYIRMKTWIDKQALSHNA